MKTIIANIQQAIRNGETITIGGGKFPAHELYRVVQLFNAAQKAEEALTFSYGGEPLPTMEKQALDDLRLALRD